MANEEFQPGDTVKLKSGGPLMTIEWIENPEREKATCTWFDDATLQSRVFELVTLVKDDGNVTDFA